MPQTLPEGSMILPADMIRIESALQELKTTNDAHASLNVKVSLHVHHEYPKHVVVHEKTYVVNSKEEEKAALASPAPKPTKHAPEVDPNPVQFAKKTAPAPNVPNAPVFSNPNLEPPYAENPNLTGTDQSPEPSNLTEMTKPERKEELGGMKKAELLDVAAQHGVEADDSMNKSEITSAINKQLNKEDKEEKTGTE